MYVTALRLTDFRSYPSAAFCLGPGPVLFLGPNGHGKTNLVEAVEYAATLGSHRTASDQPLIRRGQTQAVVHVTVRAGQEDRRSLDLDLEINLTGPNKARLNKSPVRPRDLVGALRAVVFAPEDLALAQGDPADRRGFLDALTAARWPRLAGVKKDYDRVLSQRTALLKALSGRSLRPAGAEAGDALEVWDEQLANLGAEITAARLATVRELAPFYEDRYAEIAPLRNLAETAYLSQAEPAWEQGGGATDPAAIAERLRAEIARRRGDEISRGQSLVGPHRDDLKLTVAGLPVKGYASHGEAWSVALGLRLASLDLLRADGVEPVLILDDVFAELDAVRRDRLAAAAFSAEQVLITAAVAADVPKTLAADVFWVNLGAVRRSTGPGDDGAGPEAEDTAAGAAHG
ncbi:MAG: DNA replication/repair protein RecF [Propionibacteriaceae bacterium]|jgi:DNA replication and repair protein RecF|nr:DNA replication/repair protein RecF [Propionibacteriaceae bacterium]